MNPFRKIRMAPWLPPWHVDVVDGVLYFRDLAALERVLSPPGARNRFAVVHTKPPCLLDTHTGGLLPIESLEDE